MQIKIGRKRYRLKGRFFIAIKVLAFVILILLGILGVMRVNTVMSAQVDTLNQIYEMRLELDEVKHKTDAMNWLLFGETLEDFNIPEGYGEPDFFKLPDEDPFPLTTYERDLVERVVASEARGEPFEGMEAVAQVLRDRSTTWGQSITDICLAPSQFASPYQSDVSPKVKQAVSNVFDKGKSVMEVPTTHFHADWVSPIWADAKVSRGVIGAHRFYY